MSRKLLILNLALAAAVVYAGFQIRDLAQAGKAREAAALNRKVPPVPPAPFSSAPVPPPVLPSEYADIAQKMLFDKSRDSTVVIETPPAPPPKPVPPLPLYHGQMNLGDGVLVILSESASAPHKGIHVGETIGAFQLVEATRQELTFAWEDKVIRKNVAELRDSGGSGGAPPAAAPEQPRAVAAPVPAAKTNAGPGVETGAGIKACSPNDGYPDGAVVDGYRKVAVNSPFGVMCRWEAAR